MLPPGDVADELVYMQPSSTIQMLLVNGKPSGIQLPASVELTVAQTEPGVKGDTVSNVTKPATLVRQVRWCSPLFVNAGEKIKVDPREHRYISRAGRISPATPGGAGLAVALSFASGASGEPQRSRHQASRRAGARRSRAPCSRA